MTQSDANVFILFLLLSIVWTVLRNVINEASSDARNLDIAPVSPGANRQLADQKLVGDQRVSDGIDRFNADITHGIELLRQCDPDFNARQFIDSGYLVYETVVMAFANGDRELLHDLLSSEVYNAFLEMIVEREVRCERVELRFVCLESANITDVAIFNKQAQITIAFAAQLITATRAANGMTIVGDPIKIQKVSDRWTFARKLETKKSGWKVAATGTG